METKKDIKKEVVKAVSKKVITQTVIEKLIVLVGLCKKANWKDVDANNAVKTMAKMYKMKVRDFIKNLDSHKVNFDFTLDFSNIELLKDYNLRKGVSRRKIIIDYVLTCVHSKTLVTTENVLNEVETKADYLYKGINKANVKSLNGCLVNVKDKQGYTFDRTKVKGHYILNK